MDDDVTGRALRDQALDLRSPWWLATLSVPLFALYFGGVVGGSIVQGMLLPDAEAGWLQQVGGIVAVVLGVVLLKDRRILLALFAAERPWLWRSIVTGISITLAGQVTSFLNGDRPALHGLEYFAYQATMPGI